MAIHQRNIQVQPIKKYIPHLTITLFAILLYSRTIWFDFMPTWDDERYVLINPLIRQFDWATLKTVFTTSYFVNYAPLHIVSYMLDYAIWELNPAGYHLQNVLLHALNGFLFYRFLQLMGLKQPISLVAAFIFIAHPVQVESVAWISQRKTLLATTFLLLSLISYHLYSKAENRGRLHYFASLAFFAGALLSKSVSVILPLLLLSYDSIFFQEKNKKQQLLDIFPYLAASILFAIIALHTQAADAGGGRTPHYGGGPLGTFFTMLPVFVSYLRLIIYPATLSADYPVAIKTGPDAAALASGTVIAILFAAVVWLYRKRDPRFFWAMFFIAGLLPVSQIIPLVTLMNDRYLYIPLLGVSVLAADTIYRFSPPGRYGRIFGIPVLALPLLFLPLLTFQRSADWRNGITLWSADLQKYPDNHITMTNLADAYRREGKIEESQQLYLRALTINPRYFIALNNYTNFLLEFGQPEMAQGYASNLVRHYERHAKGFEMLGLSYEMTGNTKKAEQAFRQALQIDPKMPESLTSLAIITLRDGKLDEAGALLRKAEEEGRTPQLSYSVACFELVSGNRRESVRRILESVELGFDNFSHLAGDPCLQPILDDPAIAAIIPERYRKK